MAGTTTTSSTDPAPAPASAETDEIQKLYDNVLAAEKALAKRQQELGLPVVPGDHLTTSYVPDPEAEKAFVEADKKRVEAEKAAAAS